MNWNNLIAWRYFKSKKENKLTNLSTKISIFAVTITIASLIVTLSVIRGFKEEILTKILQESGHIIIQKKKVFNPAKILEKLPEEITAIQYIEAPGIITQGNKHVQIESNQLIKKTTIGKELARKLKLNIGDKIKILVSVEKNGEIISKTITFKIREIEQFSTHEMNDSGIVIPLKLAQKKFNLKKKVNKIICYIKDSNKAQEYSKQLKKMFPKTRIYAWQDTQITFLDLIQLQKNVLLIILGIILLLASLMLMISLALLVNEKRKEIALLKILHATKFQIIKIFIKVGLFISIFSSILGTALGILITKNINIIRIWIERTINITLFDKDVCLLSHIPVHLDQQDIILTLAVGIGAVLISSIYSSYKASCVNVLENMV